MSKIHVACIDAIHCGGTEGADLAYESRTDSVNALSVNLQRLLQGHHEKLILVLDGIDRQRGLNNNTLPALARLSDVVCSINTFDGILLILWRSRYPISALSLL